MPSRVHVHVTGVVQGVGYRPFVWNLARSRGLGGWVRNACDGVHIEVWGDESDIDAFVLALSTQAPAAARVEAVHASRLDGDVPDEIAFIIAPSNEDADLSTLVSPDIATCPSCVRELFDPQDRRYHYPFINCTNCGPRFTIIDELPYDRPRTSMRGFEMCSSCSAEYADPANRRFHAQPDACFDCGPHLWWRTASDPGTVAWGRDLAASDEILDKACELLSAGGVVAIKGLGGYHLACDATNAEAVRRLRVGKRRPRKPLAVMFERLDQVRQVCEVDRCERNLLAGSVRPIVLLRRKPAGTELPAELALADEVAGPLPELGVMLPYTPVQHLLLHSLGRPVVMTSGNHSGEPIIADDQLAVARLMDVADAFLGNDRPILSRYDDSVARVIDGAICWVRRARGVAPTPIALPAGQGGAPTVLACGPEQKATLCLTRAGKGFVSQHVGDLEDADSFDAWMEALSRTRRLFGAQPRALACDMHPEYLSAKWAREQARAQSLPLVEVQHHHAHVASVLGENNIDHRVVGLALDGTGYGPDGTIWGGEVLVCDQVSFMRAGRLSCFALPGGAAAIRKPLRASYALLDACGLVQSAVGERVLERLGVEGPVVRQMLARKLNCPLTSSAGRLFDAVAALLGLVDDASYDGEPACLLEAAATLADACDSPEPPARYRMELTGDEGDERLLVIDAQPLVGAVAADVEAGVDVRVIARWFHGGFAEGVSRAATTIARSAGLGEVALSGGVFMNRLLLADVRRRLKEAGLRVLTNKDLPANDGCVAYGQAVVASARLADLTN